MELIIKPTNRCNFNCTFCSSHNLDIKHSNRVPDKIRDLIKRMHPTNIIVTGGEPLTLSPDYFIDLKRISECPISLTTNLKDFYMNPEKWENIFKDTTFNFITSFNYGSSRMWDKCTPYNEEMFINVTNRYKEVSGRSELHFIAVIDDNNENTIMNHIELAQRLETKVKINPAVKLGKQKSSYPRYKIIKAYLDIIDMGLDKYEITCSERKLGRCPFNINLLCDSTIRCCYVDNNDNLHYGICDDEISLGNERYMDYFPFNPTSHNIPREEHINNKCIYCDLFRFCNGCKANRYYAKDFPEYCDEMMKLKDRIIDTGWKI